MTDFVGTPAPSVATGGAVVSGRGSQMSIPWTDRIIVTPRTGEGAYGALYGAAVTYKARLEAVNKRMHSTAMGPDATEIVASLLAFVEPSAVITAGDRVLCNSKYYRVVSAEPLRHWTSIHHIECFLAEAAD